MFGCIIDFETFTNQHRSVCAVGLANIAKGSLENSEKFIFHTPLPCSYSTFTNLHKISLATSNSAPDFTQYWPIIEQNYMNKPLFAYNMKFDGTCLTKLINFYKLDQIHQPKYCIMKMAQGLLPNLQDYKLETVAKHLGIENRQPHNPLSDAICAAHILNTFLYKYLKGNAAQIQKILYNVEMESDPDSEFNSKENISPIRPKKPSFSSIKAQYDEASILKQHPWYGKKFVFTGTPYFNKTLEDIYHACAKLGIQVASGISKKVDMLVKCTPHPDFPLSNKEKSAKMHGIEIISEETFLGYINKYL